MFINEKERFIYGTSIALYIYKLKAYGGLTMEIQNALLDKYMDLKDQPTLQTMSNETGIQKTRIFRLFNGSEMKLSEYLSFQREVIKVQGRSTSLEKTFHECESELSIQSLQEITALMNSLLYKSRLSKTRPFTQLSAA